MSLGASPPPAPPANGFKSMLKVAVPLVALVGVVFGVTYITMYTPTDTDRDKDNNGGLAAGSVGEPPLRFFSSRRAWDPPLPTGEYRHYPLSAPSAVGSADPTIGRAFSYTLQDRIFQGFYEPSGGDPNKKRRAQYWFENRNPSSVTMQLKGLSCSACTGGRMAAIPPEVTRDILQRTAISVLPLGLFNEYDVGLIEPAFELTKLQWTEYQYEHNRDATYKVPAATNPDKWAPQWGIFELTFMVNGNPGDQPKPIQAMFATQVDGNPQQTGSIDFAIVFAVSPAFEVAPPTIDAGRIDQLTRDKHYELLVYSNTRGPGSEFGELKEPEFLVQRPGGGTDPHPFVEVKKPVRVPEEELLDIAEQLATQQKRLVKLRGAYKVPVIIHPKVGDKRMDIGLFERTIALTSGEATQTVKVTATVRGTVWLDNDRTEIDLGTFGGGPGHTRAVGLTTESTAVELAVVKAESKPSDFRYELERKPDRGGQGVYDLKITVPPSKFGGVKGEVVLEVKGPNPQKMRIPVAGLGTFQSGK